MRKNLKIFLNNVNKKTANIHGIQEGYYLFVRKKAVHNNNQNPIYFNQCNYILSGKMGESFQESYIFYFNKKTIKQQYGFLIPNTSLTIYRDEDARLIASEKGFLYSFNTCGVCSLSKKKIKEYSLETDLYFFSNWWDLKTTSLLHKKSIIFNNPFCFDSNSPSVSKEIINLINKE